MAFQLKTAVSSSFKFRPEIDELHEAFADHGVIVLEPTKGWLWTPNQHYEPGEIRPLPSERHMNPKDIELRFLKAIDAADFLYLNNLEGYIGKMCAFEIGYTLGRKPIYARKPFDAFELANGDLAEKAYLESRIVVASIPQIVEIERTRQAS